MLNAVFAATSAISDTSRPRSLGQGSRREEKPADFNSAIRSTQLAITSRLGLSSWVVSLCQPGNPTVKCSCINVLPRALSEIGPPAVLIFTELPYFLLARILRRNRIGARQRGLCTLHDRHVDHLSVDRKRTAPFGPRPLVKRLNLLGIGNFLKCWAEAFIQDWHLCGMNAGGSDKTKVRRSPHDAGVAIQIGKVCHEADCPKRHDAGSTRGLDNL